MIRRPVLRSCECDGAGVKVDCSPRELCQISEALTEIQTEQHQAAPFDILTARAQIRLISSSVKSRRFEDHRF